jgi:hypothetical protein
LKGPFQKNPIIKEVYSSGGKIEFPSQKIKNIYKIRIIKLVLYLNLLYITGMNCKKYAMVGLILNILTVMNKIVLFIGKLVSLAKILIDITS